MNREEMLGRAVERRDPWDIVIIGGGAVGMGVAVDAASRGYDVLLVEQHDFGKGTSGDPPREAIATPSCVRAGSARIAATSRSRARKTAVVRGPAPTANDAEIRACW